MKVLFTPGQSPTFELECSDRKNAFERLAQLQELFCEEQCGCCKSKRIVFNVRPVERGTYYEMKCLDCTASLSYGQKKEGGGLWIKRVDENRNKLPDNGWSVYKKAEQQQGGGATGVSYGQDKPTGGAGGNEDIPF